MLALIGTARYETLLRRLLSTKGSEAAPLLSPEIQPVIIVQGDSPELDLLRGVKRIGGTAFQAAVAGQFSGQILVNPLGSRTLVIIEQWQVNAGAAVLVQYGDATHGLGTPAATVRPLDRRTPAIAPAVTLNNVAQVGGFLTAVWAVNLGGANDEFILESPGVILAPGTSWGVAGPVNTAIRSSLIWRERALEQSEEG